MPDFCDNLEIAGKGVNDLANRWFQPLTHVSGACGAADPLGFGERPVNAGNAKSATNIGLPWHNARHSLIPVCSPHRAAL